MTTLREHLLAARAALKSDLDRAVKELAIADEMIARLDGGEPTHVVGEASASAPTFRSIREIALDILSTKDFVTLQEIVDAARAEGNESKYESISSVISRLGKEKVLQKGPRRGTYVKPPPQPVVLTLSQQAIDAMTTTTRDVAKDPASHIADKFARMHSGDDPEGDDP